MDKNAEEIENTELVKYVKSTDHKKLKQRERDPEIKTYNHNLNLLKIHRQVCSNEQCYVLGSQGNKMYKRRLVTDPNDSTDWTTAITAAKPIPAGRRIYIDTPLIEFPNQYYSNPVFHEMQAENVLIDIDGFLSGTTEIDLGSFTGGAKEAILNAPVCFGCHSPRTTKWSCSKCKLPLCSLECESMEVHQRNECRVIGDSEKNIGSHVSLFNLHLDVATTRAIKILATRESSWTCLINHSRIKNFWRSRDFHMRFGCRDGDEYTLKNILPISFAYTNDASLVLAVAMIVCAMSDTYFPNLGCSRIYPFLASLQHSCTPNVQFILNKPHDPSQTDEKSISIVATKFIPEGELLTVDFCAKPLTGRLERDGILRRKYIFKCECLLCLDPTDLGVYSNALKCQNCVCGYLLASNMKTPDVSNWSCQFCNMQMDSNNVIQTLKMAAKELKQIHNERTSLLKEFQVKWRRQLHPNHYILIAASRKMVTSIGENTFNGSWGLLISVKHANGEKILRQKPRMVFSIEKYEFMRDYCLAILRYLNHHCFGVNWKRGLVLRQLFYVNLIILLWESKCSTDSKAKSYRRSICSGMHLLYESCQITFKFYKPHTEEHKLAFKSLGLIQNLQCLLDELPPFYRKGNVHMMRRLLFAVIRARLRSGLPTQESLLAHV